MQRLLTALILIPLIVAGVFWLPPAGIFVLCTLVFAGAALEMGQVARAWAPTVRPWALAVAVPLAALPAAGLGLADSVEGGVVLCLAFAVLGPLLGTAVMLARTPVAECLPALGLFAFGIPYFAVPTATTVRLGEADPWLVILLLAVVWAGDSSAYYVGKNLGRRRLAPLISPNKTWEGALAGLLASVVAALVWCLIHLGRLDATVVTAAAAAAVAGQLGDLVQSQIKRGAGIKDSGHLLPGHGGLWDRSDAMLFAAPVLWLGLDLAGTF